MSGITPTILLVAAQSRRKDSMGIDAHKVKRQQVIMPQKQRATKFTAALCQPRIPSPCRVIYGNLHNYAKLTAKRPSTSLNALI